MARILLVLALIIFSSSNSLADPIELLIKYKISPLAPGDPPWVYKNLCLGNLTVTNTTDYFIEIISFDATVLDTRGDLIGTGRAVLSSLPKGSITDSLFGVSSRGSCPDLKSLRIRTKCFINGDIRDYYCTPVEDK